MNKKERQAWKSGKAYPMAPGELTQAEALVAASVASDSQNQSNETRVDRVRIKWEPDNFGFYCDVEAEVSYEIDKCGSRRIEWLSSGGIGGVTYNDGDGYKEEIEREQIEDLASHLSRFGISCSADLLQNKVTSD